MDKNSEKWLEPELRRIIEGLGGKCLKWVSPGNDGVPDRIVLMPNGKVYFVEVKTLGRTLEPLQRWWRKVLVALGFKHYVIDSEQALYNFVHDL